MMKIALLVFALMGMSMANLADDYKDFLAITPVASMRGIALKHILMDAEYQRIIIYLNGPDWAHLTENISSRPELIEFVQFCDRSGFDIRALMQMIHDIFIKTGEAPENFAAQARTVRELFDEILAIFPTDKFVALFAQKMSTSPDFVELITRMSSQTSYKLVEEIRKLPEVAHISEVLSYMGIDVEFALRAIYKALGWVYGF